MLNNIKSLFIKKQIFILLFNIRKLNLIKYNKSLQNKLNVDILTFIEYRVEDLLNMKKVKLEKNMII